MKERVYAVIDTNVLVSALFSPNGTSNPAVVINAVLNGAITPLYNDTIIAEYRDVLSRKKFNFNSLLIENLISAFTDFGIDTAREQAIEIEFPDSDDIVFYEVTLGMEGAYLVTGNIKHFPRRPFVVTPTEMVEILQKKHLL